MPPPSCAPRKSPFDSNLRCTCVSQASSLTSGHSLPGHCFCFRVLIYRDLIAEVIAASSGLV
jgi:hypothetical protein